LTDRSAIVKRLLGPPGPEIGYGECFDHLDRFVELELVGLDADAAVPDLRAQPRRLPACHEDRASLAAFLRSGEATGRPSIE